MRWPFKPRNESTEIRAFRDVKTGLLTLRMVGDVAFPGEASPIAINFGMTLNTVITEDAGRQLRDQLTFLLRDEGAN